MLQLNTKLIIRLSLALMSVKVSLMNHQKTLGTYLKEKRETSNLTQSEVALKLGYTTPQFISNIERGISNVPLKALKTLIELYKVQPDEVIEILLQQKKRQLKDLLLGTDASGDEKQLNQALHD